MDKRDLETQLLYGVNFINQAMSWNQNVTNKNINNFFLFYGEISINTYML